MKKNRSWITFLKAQASALAGGITDYALMIIFTEVFHLYFAFSILISGTIGGLINFIINRRWVFRNSGEYKSGLSAQMIKFALVILASVGLKSLGTHILIGLVPIDYKIGRVLVDLAISYSFNYPLIRFWVFASEKLPKGKSRRKKTSPVQPAS
jgi:putative flippase GtrA